MPPGPWFYELVEIDDDNFAHLISHGISVADVSYVLANSDLWRRNKKHMSGEWLVIGRSKGGQPIVVVVTWDDIRRSVRPITARECTKSEVETWL